MLIDPKTTEFSSKVTMVIAVSQDVSHLESFLKALKRNFNFDTQNKVIVVVTQPVRDASPITACLKRMWEELGVLNCIVVYFDRRVQIVSYNPFLLGGTLVKYTTKRLTSKNLFPDKLNNMHGHVFKVSLFELLPRYAFKNGRYFGPDVSLLGRILSRINANYTVVEPRNGKTDEDDVNEDIISGRTDFSFLRVFISNFSANGSVQYTYPHKMDDVVAVVAKGLRAPNSSYIILTFSRLFWLLCILAVFVLILVLIVEEKVVHRLFGYRDNTDSYFEIIRVFLNGNTPNFSRASNSKKLIFMSCMRLSVVVYVYFQCTLTGSLLTINYMEDVDKIKQLQATTMEILLPEYFKDIIPRDLNLHHRFVYTSIHDIWKRLMRRDEDVGYIMTYASAKLINKLAKLKWGAKVYHTTKEHLVPGYACYVFPRNSPYLDKINWLITKDVEDGLVFGIQYELEDLNAVMNFTVSKEMEPDFNIQKSPIVLTALHLKAVFIAVVAGYVISFCVFVCELVSHHLKKRSKRDVGKTSLVKCK